MNNSIPVDTAAKYRHAAQVYIAARFVMINAPEGSDLPALARSSDLCRRALLTAWYALQQAGKGDIESELAAGRVSNEFPYLIDCLIAVDLRCSHS